MAAGDTGMIAGIRGTMRRVRAAALALIAHSLGRDLAEADWWRLLDAFLLVAAHPAAS